MENAIYPPRGWNSYDAFSWTIVEQEFLKNAKELSSRLLDYGYEIATVDAYWHKAIDGVSHVDEWGRVIPDPGKWPSSANGVGFRDVADQVHRLGLKFGIHVHGGISAVAVSAPNSPILDISTGKAYNEGGREWHAKDIIVSKDHFCPYAPSSFFINTSSGAGKAFLRSLFDLFSSWGVDFVKLDCVFAENYNLETLISALILKEIDNPIILSVSPGYKASLEMGLEVKGLVNMFRVTANTWDQWSNVKDHFDVARDFAWAGLIGAEGLRGNSWIDLDMLPLGRLTDQGYYEINNNYL
ncbi:alpha-galactosidase-like [Prosopis cineraria]|uniref:alpha-galactosidase-like n=1 Tax=Prosopis cineraria TaxID=364024 RepID=UPI00240FAEFE|nr:alpha-galactosidase-like [Prosopis cineraria]